MEWNRLNNPRHKYNEADTSYELARIIGEWLDSSSLFKEWRISDTGVPGHFLMWGPRVHFLIANDKILELDPPRNAAIATFTLRANAASREPFGHSNWKQFTFKPSSPDFFEQLGQRLLEIQGNEGTSTVWRPNNA